MQMRSIHRKQYVRQRVGTGGGSRAQQQSQRLSSLELHRVKMRTKTCFAACTNNKESVVIMIKSDQQVHLEVSPSKVESE